MPNVRELVGTPYKVHGRSKAEGFDCYGLVRECVRQDYGVELPDIQYDNLDEQEYIRNQLHLLASVEKIDNLEKNCIIELSVKGIPMHIGYYLGDGLFIHSRARFGTVVEPIKRWEKLLLGVYKVKNSNL